MIAGLVVKAIGNSMKYAGDKMKTDGGDAPGPDFRPNADPAEPEKEGGSLGQLQGIMGQGGQAAEAGEAAQGAAAAMSDGRIKEPIPENKDLLAEVAENINNYTYHYKPGVGEDPSVEYSGPMAQELLQVDGYRSAVFEDGEGLLRVDTGRLAMVNAGMIADLSKRLLFMENLIKQVMQGLQAPPPPDVE